MITMVPFSMFWIVLLIAGVLFWTHVSCISLDIQETRYIYDSTHYVPLMAAGPVLLQETLAVRHETLRFYVPPNLLLFCSTHHPFLQFLCRMSFWTLVAVLTCLWSANNSTTTADMVFVVRCVTLSYVHTEVLIG